MAFFLFINFVFMSLNEFLRKESNKYTLICYSKEWFEEVILKEWFFTPVCWLCWVEKVYKVI